MKSIKILHPVLSLIYPALSEINDKISSNTSKNKNIYKNIENYKRHLQSQNSSDSQLLISKYPDPKKSEEFYEPFTQTTDWKRQEIKTNLQQIGTYYVVVFNDDQHQENYVEGKFSLAIGKLEDFSFLDYITILPYSWVKVKLFFEDYINIVISTVVLVCILLFITKIILSRFRR